jgi:hypothetical protein
MHIQVCLLLYMQVMLVDKNIEDDVPFKGEGIVTPCFPQFVKITGLAKNYGKLINVNM